MSRTLEADVVLEIVGAIEARNPDFNSMRALTSVEADLLGTITAKGVIGNGGHRYWYEGKDHLQTEEAARGFDRLGLPAAAAAMRESLDVFPDRRAPSGFELSAEQRAAAERRWKELDPAIWDADWDGAALRYVLANAGALAEVVPGADRQLARLERGWRLADERLRAALDDAAELDRDACRRSIAASDHHGAHALLRDAGPRPGRELPFWAALRAVAEALQTADHGVSVWNHRFLTEGYVLVDVDDVTPNEHGIRLLCAGPARWNLGATPRRLWSHRGDVHIRQLTGFAPRPVADSFRDRGELRLVPMKPVAVGERIVLHRKGEVIARGTVVEAVPALGARPS